MNIKQRLFNVFISALTKRTICKTWQQANINQFNKRNLTLSCPWCDSTKSQFVSRWHITDHFGLFDNSLDRLKKIYAIDVPTIIPRRFVHEYRRMIFEWISGHACVDYRQCEHCGLVFQNYPHTQEYACIYYNSFYRLKYEKRTSDNVGTIYGRNDERWLRQQQMIGEYFLNTTGLPIGSKIVDVGAAEGWVCKYLEDRGMEAFGIEPSSPMANYAQHVLKIKNFKCEDYSINSYPPDFFDGIITHHVAEHVVNIADFFKALSIHLKKGGYLLIQVPCTDNLKPEKDYETILTGGHIYCFSEFFLRNHFAKLGMDIIECKKTACDLSDMDQTLLSPWGTTVWADDPCGISILAVKTIE
jgi:cyclopropane fatty-acyl-phospholipid synthase-like methyltransferase